MNGVRDGELLEHLQAEHHKLNLALSALRQQAGAGLLKSLHEFKQDLSAHFAQEETDGCLSDAAARCPSALPNFEAIKAEDDDLLHLLDELIEDAAQDVPDDGRLLRRFESLSERLHRHEAAESRLLLYAFGGETAEYDVEGDD